MGLSFSMSLLPFLYVKRSEIASLTTWTPFVLGIWFYFLVSFRCPPNSKPFEILFDKGVIVPR